MGLNHVFLVGRLVKVPEIYKTETGKTIATMVLAVTKPYKSINGEYESDFIECTLWQNIAETTVTYVKKGDLIGIKGRLASHTEDKKDGKYFRTNEVMVDRVTFLSTNHKKEETEEPKKKEEKREEKIEQKKK